MRRASALVTVAIVALAGCTFELRDPGVTVACGAMQYEIDPGAAGDAQVAAVVAGFEAYAAATGRPVEYLGESTSPVTGPERDPTDPVLVAFSWPAETPTRFGFAEPAIVDGRYVGGTVLVNPMFAGGPPETITRLVMHEIGHLVGLADVEAPEEIMDPDLSAAAWGAGDLVGLHVTHGGCG